jgi:hypothetical protein
MDRSEAVDLPYIRKSTSDKRRGNINCETSFIPSSEKGKLGREYH